MILSSQGVILKVFPYSNTSTICNVFTNDHGKLTFIAKGVRKPKNVYLSGEETVVYASKSCHWKLTSSTTMTFATTVKNIREDMEDMFSGCENFNQSLKYNKFEPTKLGSKINKGCNVGTDCKGFLSFDCKKIFPVSKVFSIS